MIDNYDSFTFNLVHYILDTGVEVNVFRNNKVSIDDLTDLNPGAIVISHGPSRPEDASISLNVVKHFSGLRPILGVCLGHQVIAQCFGGDNHPGKPDHAWKNINDYRTRILFP